ncbi:MAG: hypothetical protein ACRDE2_15100 [Chitinophagaceae bacterium]
MKYRYYLLFFVLSFFTANTAFSQARETTAGFQNAQHPAFTINYNFPSEIVTGAIQQRLKQDRISFRVKKGIISCQGVNYPVLGPELIDLYFQVNGLGRRGRDGSIVTLLISKGKDNFISSTNDSSLARNALQFLNSLQQDISLYSLQQQINDQQKSIDSKSKQYNKLLKDSKKMQDKRYSLQRDLSSETDSGKQDKIRKKIRKLDKGILNNQTNIKNRENELQQLKGQLSLLHDQLSTQMSKGK